MEDVGHFSMDFSGQSPDFNPHPIFHLDAGADHAAYPSGAPDDYSLSLLAVHTASAQFFLMTATNDREVARNFQQNEIAKYAYEAAQKPFSNSIISDPDAALALELQKMEVQTPIPRINDDESQIVALQLQEQEHFEQEQHDAALAQRMMETDDRYIRRQNHRRVDQLSEALEGMERTSPTNGMDFSRAVRGPSMDGQFTVFGPANIPDDTFDDSDTETDGEREQSILPRPRLRQQTRPFQDPHRLVLNPQGRLVLNQQGNQGQQRLQPDNSGSDQAQGRRPQHRLVPIQNRPELPDDEIQGLPGQFRQPHRHQLQRYQQRQNQLPGQHGFGRTGGMLGFRGRVNYPRDQDIDPNDYEALWELQERNGDVRSQGLTRQQIGRIPHHKYKPKPQTSVSGKDCCRICLSEYVNDENVKTLPCFHSYHKNCIDKWLQSQAVCPVCRENIRIN